MVDRTRAIDNHGLCAGLDAANLAEAQAAGNAVCPQVVEWTAHHLMRQIHRDVLSMLSAATRILNVDAKSPTK